MASNSDLSDILAAIASARSALDAIEVAIAGLTPESAPKARRLRAAPACKVRAQIAMRLVERGVSMREASIRMGMEGTYLSQFISGKNKRLSAQAAARLAEITGMRFTTIASADPLTTRS